MQMMFGQMISVGDRLLLFYPNQPDELPTLQLLPNGELALLTAHRKNHCRLYLSADGNGREWSKAHVLTSLSGGNASMRMKGHDSLVVITPANRHIDAWSVAFHLRIAMTQNVSAPAGYEDTEALPHASIAISEQKLDLSRQFLIGTTYVFEVSAVDAEGCFSAPARSAEFMNR